MTHTRAARAGPGCRWSRSAAAVGSALAVIAAWGLATQGRVPLAGTAAGLAVVGLVCADGGNRDDVDRLVESVERLAAGEFDVEVPTDGEGGRLQAAVADLADALRACDRERAESRRWFEAVFGGPNTLFGLLDPDGTLRRVNDSALAYVDAGRDELVGEPFPATPWWADTPAEDVREWIDRAADGEYVEYEAHLDDADGTRHWVRGTFRPVTDESGEVVSILVSGDDVTERKARERDLRETKRRLELALEATNTGICEWDLETDVASWNESLERLVGLEPGGFEGTFAAFRRRVHPDDVAELDDAIEGAIETGEPCRAEFRMRHEDGSWIWVAARGRFVSDERSGEHMVGVVNDVTERKEKERRARERERQLARYKEYTDDVLDAIDDAFYVLDEDYDLLRWNASLADVTGYSGAELDGMDSLELVAPEDRGAVRRGLDRIDEFRGVPLEIEVVAKGGERIPFELVASPLEDPDGDRVIVGIGRDVSERRENERRLSRLVQNVPGSVYRCKNEPGQPAEFVSEGVRDLAGYDPEAFESHEVSWWEDVVAARSEELWEEVQAAFERREAFELTYPIETADGERRWVKEQGRGVYAADGSVEALEGVVIDVTERVEYERELERTQHLLEQSQRLASVGAWELQVRDGDVVDVEATDEAYRIHDRPPGEPAEFDRWLEFVHPDDRPHVGECLERAIESGEGYDVEVRLSTADGNERWVRTIGEPVREDGEVVAIRGSIQDVTERKRRENELERYREYTDRLLDAIDDVFYVLDADGELRRWNRALPEATGYTDEEIAELSRDEFFHEGDRKHMAGAVANVFETGTSRTESHLLTKSGERIPYEFAGVALEDLEGNPVLVGIGRDVSERKERERELERTKNLLAQAGRLASVGGWEVDYRSEPPEVTWTDELYRIHGLPIGTDVSLAESVELFHPEDRQKMLDVTRRLEERGESYDVELRLHNPEGRTRWVRAIGEAVREGGETVKVRGTVQEITDRKEREQALESLHEAARELLGTETETDVARVVVEAADEALDVPGVCVYLLDGAATALEPVAASAEFADLVGDAGPVAVGDGSLVSECFLTETPTAFDGSEEGGPAGGFGPDVGGGLLVPIGDHGVFAAVAPEPSVDDATRRLVETLVATTEAAFDRLESEADLRERDRELAEQNRRLRRQVRVTDIIRGIDQAMIGAASREEIETVVCERLVDAEGVAFAWIGRLDASGRELVPRAWAGPHQEYLDAAVLGADARAPDPSVATATSEEPTVVESVADRIDEAWGKRAIAHDFQALVSVPLSFEEYFYGVLTVYADEPGAFGDLERSVFAELGETIANSINAVETRQALYADTVVELTLELSDSEDVLARIAREADCTVEYEGLAAQSADESRLFFATEGAQPDAVAAVLEGLVSVADFRLVEASGDRCLFEASVAGDALVARLVRHGASPRTIRATGTEQVVVVDVPTTTDVREFVEVVRERHPSAELVARHTVTRSMHTRGELVASLLEALTDRQLEVLRTAYFAGFFEWPRTSTGEEIAEMLGVTQPTVNRHLRLGQQRLLAQLIEDEATALAPS